PPSPAPSPRSLHDALPIYTLRYFSTEPVHRKWHHDLLTFGLTYAWSENFVLPLSHDEVVHMKGSLLGKMPGDRWQRFANLRALRSEEHTSELQSRENLVCR